MSAMEQLWLILSLVGLVTGFGLVVALLFLKRVAPLALPPVVTAVIALLVMGLASFFGVYLRVIGMPRSFPAYRVLNAAAWGYAAFALLFYILRDRRLRRPGGRRGKAARRGGGGGRTENGAALWVHVRDAPAAVIGGLAVFATAFLAAHPPATGVLSPGSVAAAVSMITVELLVGVLAIVVGLRALSLSGATASRPWRAYLRGFGVALLLLIPANLLDFGVSVALRAAGETARDGFVFAAGYGIANVVLIVAIVSGFRQSASGEALAVPQQLVDAFGITRREREVVEKLLEGKSDRQIAEELYISPRTVDTHLRSVFRKCGVTSRMQLTRLASTYGELRNSR